MIFTVVKAGRAHEPIPLLARRSYRDRCHSEIVPSPVVQNTETKEREEGGERGERKESIAVSQRIGERQRKRKRETERERARNCNKEQ